MRVSVWARQGPESSEGKARGAIRAIADARQLRDENSHLQQQLTAQGDLEAQLAAAQHRLEECERSLATVRVTSLPIVACLASVSCILTTLPQHLGKNCSIACALPLRRLDSCFPLNQIERLQHGLTPAKTIFSCCSWSLLHQPAISLCICTLSSISVVGAGDSRASGSHHKAGQHEGRARGGKGQYTQGCREPQGRGRSSADAGVLPCRTCLMTPCF